MGSPYFASMLTAEELRIIARFGFGSRLDKVIEAARTYQTARKSLDTGQVKRDVAAAALEAAEELSDDIAVKPVLLKQAKDQFAAYERQVSNAERELTRKADVFFDIAGEGEGIRVIIQAMEEHDWAITVADLREHLQREGAAA